MTRRIRVKFCGITSIEDALAAAALGVDAIGLVFTPLSPRCVPIDRARAIRRALPPFVSSVALFMDDAPERVAEVLAQVAPDCLQFHGGETQADCERFGRPWLKAVPMQAMTDVDAYMAAYPGASGFLLDSHGAGGQGGSGVCFDWTRAPRTAPRPLILAGGLNADNVASAIAEVWPWGVDVSSGIERAPGIKDAEKMRRFIDEVGRACRQDEQ